MPRPAPVQRRSRKTMERLIAATVSLLELRRPADVSVQDIVTEADSSVGSFYARFKSKEDLLEYVRTRMWMEATDRWRAARDEHHWDGLELSALVRGLIQLFDKVEGLHLRARGAFGGTKTDPAALAFNTEVETGAVELLLDHVDEIGHIDAQVAAHFAVRLCLAAVRQEGALALDPAVHEGDLDQLAQAVTGYLKGSVATESAGDVEFFDIWG